VVDVLDGLGEMLGKWRIRKVFQPAGGVVNVYDWSISRSNVVSIPFKSPCVERGMNAMRSPYEAHESAYRLEVHGLSDVFDNDNLKRWRKGKGVHGIYPQVG